MTKSLILSGVAVLALSVFTTGMMSADAYAEKVKTTTTTTTAIPDPVGNGVIERTTVVEETTPTPPVTITKTIAVTPTMIEGTIPVNFVYLDVNADGVLSRAEVGEKLFFLFDTDGNKVVDNVEIKKNQVITVIPFEKTQLTMIDFDDDGKADVVNVTSDDFMNFSMLNRFDKDNDGLSAEEFIGHSALELDTDKSGVVEYPEWKEVYVKSVTSKAGKQFGYQQ